MTISEAGNIEDVRLTYIKSKPNHYCMGFQDSSSQIVCKILKGVNRYVDPSVVSSFVLDASGPARSIAPAADELDEGRILTLYEDSGDSNKCKSHVIQLGPIAKVL